MKKFISAILLIVMLLAMSSTFVACNLVEKLIPLEAKYQFPELEDYVLYDDTIEYEGIIYQNSNLGYIGVRLADSSVTEVYMRGRLDFGYNKDGSLNIIPVYAYATDFLCNNQTVTQITMDIHSHLRLYENTVHNVPNVTHFYFFNTTSSFYDDGKGTPQVEKNAINVDCDYIIGDDILTAFRCFPLDVDRFVFSRGIGIYTKLKVVVEPPKNGVQPLTAELYAPCNATVGKHKVKFNNPYIYIQKEGDYYGNDYYFSAELYNTILQPGSKLPKAWIPQNDYFTFDAKYAIDLTYDQKKIIVFESTQKYKVTASNISAPFGEYTSYKINDNDYVIIEPTLTGIHWDF